MSVEVYRAKSVSQFSPRITLPAVLGKTLETHIEFDQVAFLVLPAKVKQNLEEILVQFSQEPLWLLVWLNF